MSARTLLQRIEALGFRTESNVLLNSSVAWIELKKIVLDQFPELTSTYIGGTYEIVGKKGRIQQVMVTKKNDKTWVMYELEGSNLPGCRWMILPTRAQKKTFGRLKQQLKFPLT